MRKAAKEEGNRAFKEGRLEVAVKGYSEAIRLNGSNQTYRQRSSEALDTKNASALQALLRPEVDGVYSFALFNDEFCKMFLEELLFC